MGKQTVLYSLSVCLEGDVNLYVQWEKTWSTPPVKTWHTGHHTLTGRAALSWHLSLLRALGMWPLACQLLLLWDAMTSEPSLRPNHLPHLSERERTQRLASVTRDRLPSCSWTPKDRDWIRCVIAAADMGSHPYMKYGNFSPSASVPDQICHQILQKLK